MPELAGPFSADRKVAWIVGVACVGCMVAIASSLSYAYWQEHGTKRTHRVAAAPIAKSVPAKSTPAKSAPVKSAPAPAQAATAQAVTADAVPLPDRKPQIPGTDVAAATPGVTPQPVTPKTGDASWYDFAGEETANGETMDEDALTAAHPTLPFGTEVEVENVANGRRVVVRVNDRGPYAGGRIIDVSEAAAQALGMVEDGVAEVEITPVRNAEGLNRSR